MTPAGPLILASASPRRRELLTAMGIPHEVRPSRVDESRIAADHPKTFAFRAAYAKARDVADRAEPGRWVVASDTVVALGLILLAKPADAADAVRMLAMLSGKVHQVTTAVALTRAGGEETHLRAATTSVRFRNLAPDEISAYVATGDPMDKAGGYGIQGRAADLIEGIEGDYFNVVGLPCGELAALLGEVLPGLPCSVPATPERWTRRFPSRPA